MIKHVTQNNQAISETIGGRQKGGKVYETAHWDAGWNWYNKKIYSQIQLGHTWLCSDPKGTLPNACFVSFSSSKLIKGYPVKKEDRTNKNGIEQDKK